MSCELELLVVGLDGAVPSVVKALMAKGRLPAFRALAERGVWMADCRPPFPTITPTCWSSFATGATPAAHGATCQDIHLPGMGAGQVVSAYHSQNITAERFWEAAARIGKRSLIMQLPASGPARSGDVYQVAGAGCAAIRKADHDKPTVPSQPVVPALYVDTDADAAAVSWQLRTPASGQWQPDEYRAAQASIAPEGATARVTVAGVDDSVETVEWTILVETDRARIRFDDEDVPVVRGNWSQPFARSVRRGNGTVSRCWFRARLFEADPASQRLRLYITETGPASEFASPAPFAQSLDAIPLVPANHGHGALLSSLDTMDAYLEAERHNFEWQLAALDAGIASGSPQIAVVYSVYLDSLNHAFRNIVEGLAVVPDGERETIVSFYHRAYELADWFLAQVLERAGADTTTVVLSDHGSVGYTSLFDPVAALETAGLLVTETPAGGRRTVDYSRSLVYPISTCHVYVNLAGREPDGIVDPAQFDETVDRAIAALLGARTESGVAPVAFAVRREEAGLVGLGGERIGDVVYGIRGGLVGGHIGGVHACQIPTAVSRTGDIRSLCMIAGPGFARGSSYDGPVWLWDLAPTLSSALSYPMPAHSDGRIVHQILER